MTTFATIHDIWQEQLTILHGLTGSYHSQETAVKKAAGYAGQRRDLILDAKSIDDAIKALPFAGVKEGPGAELRAYFADFSERAFALAYLALGQEKVGDDLPKQFKEFRKGVPLEPLALQETILNILENSEHAGEYEYRQAIDSALARLEYIRYAGSVSEQIDVVQDAAIAAGLGTHVQQRLIQDIGKPALVLAQEAVGYEVVGDALFQKRLALGSAAEGLADTMLRGLDEEGVEALTKGAVTDPLTLAVEQARIALVLHQAGVPVDARALTKSLAQLSEITGALAASLPVIARDA